MDYGALPPEINSGQMYAGIGSGPLVDSAMAWQMLSVELGSAGAAYSAVVTALTTGAWTGPSAISMAAAAAPFAVWMLEHSIQCEQGALSALAAADAFETARAGVIDPASITANRATLATLVATNFMGVNSAAIAATEAQYAEYWAQDASIMYGYAGDSAGITGGLAASPFLPPIPNSDGGGPAAGAAAASTGQAAGQAGSNTSSAMSSLGSMGSSMGSLGSAASAPAQMAGQVPGMLGKLASPASSMSSMMGPLSSMGGMSNFLGPLAGMPGMSAFLNHGGSWGMGGMHFGGGGASPGMLAGMGRAGSLEGSGPRLSVPASWAGKGDPMSSVKVLSSEAPLNAAPAAGEAPAGAAGGSPRVMAPMMGGAGGGTHQAGLASMGVVERSKLRTLMAPPKIKPLVF
jgi:PPE-repeat protein